jgi:opacity protein-like surface antigen
MKKITLTSAAIMSALSLNSASAVAADSNWNGAYGGLSVGYQDGQLKGADGGTLNYYGINNPDPGSPTGGVFAGYNYQIPQSNFVTGIEASFNIGGEEQSKAGSNFPASNPEAKVSVPYDTALKAKLGYAADQFLPYIQAGVVGAETRFNVTDNDGTDLGSGKFSAGWLAGVGVDYAIKDNLFLRASYSYMELANKDYLNTAGEFDHRLDLNDFQIGAGYKF